MKYDSFIKRNLGYIDLKTQKKVQNTKILIAGCGIGSTIAECLLRAGFVNLILVDFDTVEESNLNRQIFKFDDVGKFKADSLKNRLLDIYPNAKIEVIKEPISLKNTKKLVSKSDIVMDTIDFLDLNAILNLHEEAHIQKKPLISMVSAGFGAIGFLIDNKKDFLKKEMKIKSKEKVLLEDYSFYLTNFLKSCKNKIDNDVLDVMFDVMDKLKNGIPCPAPHVSSGSFFAGSLATYLAISFLKDKNTKLKNKIHYLSFNKIL